MKDNFDLPKPNFSITTFQNPSTNKKFSNPFEEGEICLPNSEDLIKVFFVSISILILNITKTDGAFEKL